MSTEEEIKQVEALDNCASSLADCCYHLEFGSNNLMTLDDIQKQLVLMNELKVLELRLRIAEFDGEQNPDYWRKELEKLEH